MEPASEYVKVELPAPGWRLWRHCATGAVLLLGGAAAGALGMRTLDQRLLEYDFQHVPQAVASLARGTPLACRGWEARCLAGAAAARAQGLGEFFLPAVCNEAARGKCSCANRKSAWASPHVYLPPFGGRDTERLVTDTLASPTLMLFLPGTGTAPEKVRTLVAAASDMGYYAMGLSYASNPLAVSQTDVWCTREGSNASTAACNRQLHESVLFGSAAGVEAGGLWDVPREESVVAVLAGALSRVAGWSELFLTGRGEPRWERIVVSGHSQGASHAAYLSTRVAVKGAVLFSGPQECAGCADWLGDAPKVSRRAAFSHREECGDRPEKGPEAKSYCALHFPNQLAKNLDAMGLHRGFLGARRSGYVITDFEPLSDEGRDEHNAQALREFASPAQESLWKVLFADLGEVDTNV